MSLLSYSVLFSISAIDITKEAKITASSYYNIAPYENSFLPELAADEDNNTAWSSLHEGCDAKLFFEFPKEEKITRVCARSRDMVDDPNVLSTDDSVIESYDLIIDGEIDTTCILPDWRQVYCCSTTSRKLAKNVTLSAKKCRERENGPANTGFKTVRIYKESSSNSLSDITILGNENSVHGGSDVKLVSTGFKAKSSDLVASIGHDSINTRSDQTSIVGYKVNVTNSDGAVAFGNNLIVDNADESIVIGNNLKTSVPTQIVLGKYNAESSAKFVVSGGSIDNELNLMEVYADGTIFNKHIKQLEERIHVLETILNNECGAPNCKQLKLRYKEDGCCVTYI